MCAFQAVLPQQQPRTARFLAHEGLADRISAALAALDVDDVTELARVGKEIRQWILETPFPAELNADIETAWNKMVADAGTDQNFGGSAFFGNGRRFA